MDFLINNAGWFFCIVIVSILALIGYKADKKEKQQSNNVESIPKKEITNIQQPEQEQQEENNDLYYGPIEEKKQDTFSTDIDTENMEDLFEPLSPITNSAPTEQPKEEINYEQNIVENETYNSQSQLINEPIPNEPNNIIDPNLNEFNNEPILNENYNSQPQQINEIPNEQNNDQYQTITELNEIQNNEPIENPEPSQNNIEQPTQQLEQIVPDLNNVENLNISSQDLENKNSHIEMNQQPQEENVQVQNQNIEQPNDIQPEPINEIKDVQEEQINEQIQSEVNDYQALPPAESISNEPNNIEEPIPNEFDNNQPQPINGITNEQNNAQESMNEFVEHEFDNEVTEEDPQNQEAPVQEMPIEESIDQNTASEQFGFNTVEQNYSGEIPEIFGQQNSNTNNNQTQQVDLNEPENLNNVQEKTTGLYSDSIDDDIWKF